MDYEAYALRAIEKKYADSLKIKWWGNSLEGISFAEGQYYHYKLYKHPEGHIVCQRPATKEELESINAD